jgi:hypothetical protein
MEVASLEESGMNVWRLRSEVLGAVEWTVDNVGIRWTSD